MATVAPAGLTVVLDPSWTAGPRDSPRVESLRSHFAAAVEDHDLFEEALDLLDSWAADAHLADLLVVEGVTYWYRVRETLWHWVHERLWRYALASIDAQQPSDSILAPRSEQALIDVATAQGRSIEIAFEPGGMPDQAAGRVLPAASHHVPTIARRAFRRLRPRPESPAVTESRRRTTILEARLARLASSHAPVVVLAVPSNYQPIGAAADQRRGDPNLGSVLPASGQGRT